MGVGSSHPVPCFPLRSKILAQGVSLLVSVCLLLVSVCLVLVVLASTSAGGGGDKFSIPSGIFFSGGTPPLGGGFERSGSYQKNNFFFPCHTHHT